MADVTSREKARGSRGMSASAFSRRAAGNLQNVIVFRRLRGFLHLGRKILEGGSSSRHMFSVLSLHAKGCTYP